LLAEARKSEDYRVQSRLLHDIRGRASRKRKDPLTDVPRIVDELRRYIFQPPQTLHIRDVNRTAKLEAVNTLGRIGRYHRDCEERIARVLCDTARESPQVSVQSAAVEQMVMLVKKRPRAAQGWQMPAIQGIATASSTLAHLQQEFREQFTRAMEYQRAPAQAGPAAAPAARRAYRR
jgi:hypothetical protein